jgi:hypothetical protein
LDARTANLIKKALHDGSDDRRMSEDALRIIESRIYGKCMLYFKDLARRTADNEGIEDTSDNAG